MNKISEKAVWDELVPTEDETISPAPYGQPVQPQMMFCYNCSQVIPANSTFCPWCQINLFVTCPKCGNQYSSQYPACNQCGTNRANYYQEQERIKRQRLEEERQEAERKRQDEERKRIEEERKRKKDLEQAAEEDKRKSLLRTRFWNENVEIIKTTEFKKAEKFLGEFENYYKKQSEEINLLPGIAWVFLIIGMVSMFAIGAFDNFIVGILCEIVSFVIAIVCFCSANTVNNNKYNIKKQFKKYIENQILDKEIRVIVEASLLLLEKGAVRQDGILEKKTDFLILSYRKAFYKEYELYRSLCYHDKR